MSKHVVAVLFGGAVNHDLSKLSGEHIIPAIPSAKFIVLPVYINTDGEWLLYDGNADNIANVLWEQHGTPALLSTNTAHTGLIRIVGTKIKAIPVDVALNLTESGITRGADMAGLLSLAGILNAGCSARLHMLSGSRRALYQVLGNGTDYKLYPHEMLFVEKTEDWLDKASKRVRNNVGYPCNIWAERSIVPPVEVSRKNQLAAAVEVFPNKNLVAERTISGTFFYYGFIDETLSLPCIIEDEQVATADNKLPEAVLERANKAAQEILAKLTAFGFGAIRLLYNEETDTIYFDNIHTMPQLYADSLFMRMFSLSGYRLPEVLNKMLVCGEARLLTTEVESL